MSLRGRTAIAGLGMTPMGKVYGRTASDFAGEALSLALADAGLDKTQLDGLLICPGLSAGDLTISLQHSLGLRDLRLVSQMSTYGASVGAMLQYAALSIAAGLANNVAILFADAPLQPAKSTGDAYAARRRSDAMESLRTTYGDIGVNLAYARATQRHMHRFGTTSEQLGAIAVGQRQWAAMSPLAQMRAPISLADHQASRWIAEPLHLLDCCLVSNGAVAVILTSAEQARDLRQPPVYLLGVGQGHPGGDMRAGHEPDIHTGAVASGRTAMEMAGVTVADVDCCQLYDCYTYTVLVTLEDYGFCQKGEGGDFVSDGKLAPGGSLPTNTGGGQLSGYYMWGMTPMSEAIIQARGQAGERQVPRREVMLVSGNGGVLNYHSTMVLSPTAVGGTA